MSRAKSIRRIETKLHLPHGFVDELEREPSDWAFIVKLAVIAEGVLANIIVEKLRNEALFDFVSRLNNSSRIDLASRLGLLTETGASILRVLASVRNAFAHRAENLTVSLRDYILKLSEEHRSVVVKALLGAGQKSRLKEQRAIEEFADSFRKMIFDRTLDAFLTLTYEGAPPHHRVFIARPSDVPMLKMNYDELLERLLSYGFQPNVPDS
jgi:hypothetical protein